MIDVRELSGMDHPADRGEWSLVGYLLHDNADHLLHVGWTLSFEGHDTLYRRVREYAGEIPRVIAVTPIYHGYGVYRMLGLDGRSSLLGWWALPCNYFSALDSGDFSDWYFKDDPDWNNPMGRGMTLQQDYPEAV